MLRYEAHTDAGPDTVWALLACPTRWAEWAPHVRGAWGLGWPQVREGAVGAVRLLGVVPVPARISRVNPGESWAWQIGLVTIDHIIEPLPDDEGTVVAVAIDAPAPLEAVLARTYGPIADGLVGRLARAAEATTAAGG
jgi:Polyketide cyclase / dehydrase and lipid transport